MTSPMPYTAIPPESDLSAALSTGSALTDPHPSLLRRLLAALRPMHQYVSRFITPEQYGAVGDGITDDTAALRAALKALEPGQTLWATRVYLHTAVLDDLVDGHQANGYTVTGGGTFRATVPSAAAIKVHGNDVVYYNIRMETLNRTTRLDPYEAQKFVVYGDRFTATRVHSTGSAATGFFLTGVDGFRLIDCTVTDTFADGIHLTGGSSNGIVVRPIINDAGDDGVAVVSYVGGSDPGLCSNITVWDPRVDGSKAGRGVACVGGDNITFINVYTNNTFASGIYISREDNGVYLTYPWSRVRVIGRHTVRNANRNTDPRGVAGPVDHGAVMIVNQTNAAMCYDLLIEGVTTYDTRANNPWEVGAIITNGGTVNATGIVVRDMVFNNGPATAYITQNATQMAATTTVNETVYTNFRRYAWTRNTTSTAVAS